MAGVLDDDPDVLRRRVERRLSGVGRAVRKRPFPDFELDLVFRFLEIRRKCRITWNRRSARYLQSGREKLRLKS
jgi:hypothetical protein